MKEATQPTMEIVHQPAPQPPDIVRQPPTPADMLQAVIEKGVTSENVAAVEQIVKLYEHMEDRNAVRAFNEAFVKLQSELPIITATTVIPNRGKYARFEDIMRQITPHLVKNGFTVSFSQDFKDGRHLETMTLRHAKGHSVSNAYGVRSAGRSDSEAQGDCKASSIAKRNALRDGLSLSIQQDCFSEDNDASLDGDPNAKVTSAQADELERRAKMVNADIGALLRYAGAKSFAEIPAAKYAELDDMLSRKERRGR